MVRDTARKKDDAIWNGPYVVVNNHAKRVRVRLMNGKLMLYHESDSKEFKFSFFRKYYWRGICSRSKSYRCNKNKKAQRRPVLHRMKRTF
jgi:hypothetical protein